MVEAPPTVHAGAARAWKDGYFVHHHRRGDAAVAMRRGGVRQGRER